ncbi:MAG: 16S rRNA (cytidine(1402)-2'-O)-methyltransferase [Hyphomicrobiaceae bacterium]
MTTPSPPPTDTTATTLAASTAALRDALAKTLEPGLHIVATPIGNLADITLRAIATLANADVIYCEDTRHSRTLAAHFGIKTPLRAYHEHNADAARPEILAALATGRRIALISDAGTPLISDPGYKLVNDCLDAHHLVTCIPGPSAVITALALAGLPTDQFLFAGFLPPKSAARQTRLKDLSTIPATLVFYEAPSRVIACLTDIATQLGQRACVIARELTKMHEQNLHGTAAELAAYFEKTEPRGEFVIIVAPPGTVEISDDDIEKRLQHALKTMSVKDAVKAVAEELKQPRHHVYDLALRIKESLAPSSRGEG